MAWHPVSVNEVRVMESFRNIQKKILGNVASSRIFSSRRLSWSENKWTFSSLSWIIKFSIYIFDNSKELPHKRIVRNVRKLLTSNPSRVELENLFTALPRGSRPKRNYDDDDDWAGSGFDTQNNDDELLLIVLKFFQ